jgi:hypothetical protein
MNTDSLILIPGFEAFAKLLQEPLRGPMMKTYLQQAHGRLCEKMDKLVRMPVNDPASLETCIPADHA